MPTGDYVLSTDDLAANDPWSWETTNDNDQRQLPETEARFLTIVGPYGLYPASSSEQRPRSQPAPGGARDVARFADPGATGQVAFSPDGGTIAVRGSILYDMDERLVQVWDYVTGREIARLPHDANVTDLLFSPEGRLLTASEAGIVSVWDIASGRTNTTLAHDRSVYLLALDGTARTLATVSGVTSLGADETQTHAARIWDMSTRQARVRFAIEGPVHDLAFSPDGANLITVSKDGTTRIWETSSGREVARVREPAVATARFSADGRWLATLSVPDSGKRVLRLWSWRPADLIDSACAVVTRNLSLEEWRQYIGAEPPRRTCPALPAPR
jgi:WD40 repeat protein